MGERKRTIEIRFPWANARVRADLLDTAAPTACAAVWELCNRETPVEVLHATFSGRELGMHLDQTVAEGAGLKPEMPAENLSAFPAPGDVMYQYCPPLQFGGIDEHVYDISICYGPDTRLLMPWGWSPASRFASVWYEDRQILAEVGSGMMRRGAETLIFAQA